MFLPGRTADLTEKERQRVSALSPRAREPFLFIVTQAGTLTDLHDRILVERRALCVTLRYVT